MKIPSLFPYAHSIMNHLLARMAKLGLVMRSTFSSKRINASVIASVWYSSSEFLNCRSLPNPDPPPKGDQVFCLTKLNSVIGNLSPLLSTIRYDYHSRLLLKPNPPKNLRTKSYLKYRQSFFLSEKYFSRSHFSFWREWANANVHSSMESFWGHFLASRSILPPPLHDVFFILFILQKLTEWFLGIP